MMLDGRTTEGEAAMAVLAAEREVLAKASRAGVETQAAMLRARWQSDALLRKGFRHNFRRYRAYASNRKLKIVDDSRRTG